MEDELMFADVTDVTPEPEAPAPEVYSKDQVDAMVERARGEVLQRMMEQNAGRQAPEPTYYAPPQEQEIEIDWNNPERSIIELANRQAEKIIEEKLKSIPNMAAITQTTVEAQNTQAILQQYEGKVPASAIQEIRATMAKGGIQPGFSQSVETYLQAQAYQQMMNQPPTVPTVDRTRATLPGTVDPVAAELAKIPKDVLQEMHSAYVDAFGTVPERKDLIALYKVRESI